ncbi:hypothetical protein AB1L30_22420 [Bremerella sp. JC817]|uniref:hypothetical protein n=1 Tax=Bremerella sp. JC817 TaxID=3231756 RepID=UPI00345B2869
MYLNMFLQADEEHLTVELSPVDMEVIQALWQPEQISTEILFGAPWDDYARVVTSEGVGAAAATLIDYLQDDAHAMRRQFYLEYVDPAGSIVQKAKVTRGLRWRGEPIRIEAGIGRCQLFEQQEDSWNVEPIEDLRDQAAFLHDSGTVAIHFREISLPIIDSLKRIQTFAQQRPGQSLTIDIPASRVLQQPDPDEYEE